MRSIAAKPQRRSKLGYITQLRFCEERSAPTPVISEQTCNVQLLRCFEGDPFHKICGLTPGRGGGINSSSASRFNPTVV